MNIPPELLEPFRPRAARVVSGALGLITTIGIVVVMLILRQQGVSVTPGAAAGAVTAAAIVVGLCAVQYRVQARPSAAGLTVQNLMERRTVAWEEIVTVRFGPDSSWVELDLADASTLAVMGIQRSDGSRGAREARRLATLVALHEGRGSSPA